MAPDGPDLPGEIGIFPLPGALLLPGGRLPLNVFEPRYLALIEESLKAERMFGMIQPDESAPVGEHGPGLYRVGCLGRLSSFAETEDGRFLVALSGVARFRVAEEVAPHRGFRRVRVDYAGFAADPSPADPAVDRPRLVTALRAYFRSKGIEANWEAIERAEIAALVVNLCMVCPFDAREKQALLEAPDATARAATLEALLRMDSLAAPGQDTRPS